MWRRVEKKSGLKRLKLSATKSMSYDSSTRSQYWDELKRLDMQARMSYDKFKDTPLGMLRMEGARHDTSVIYFGFNVYRAPTLAEVVYWWDMYKINMKAQDMGLAPASAVTQW